MELPEWIQTTEDQKEFREFVYPLRELHGGDASIFADRAVLSSLNDIVDVFNSEIAELRQVRCQEYLALDRVENDDPNRRSEPPPHRIPAFTNYRRSTARQIQTPDRNAYNAPSESPSQRVPMQRYATNHHPAVL